MLIITPRLKKKEFFKILFVLALPFFFLLIGLSLRPQGKIEKSLTHLIQFPDYYFFPFYSPYTDSEHRPSSETLFCTKKNELNITSEQAKFYLETKYSQEVHSDKTSSGAYLHSTRVFRNTNLIKIEVRGPTDESILNHAKTLIDNLKTYMSHLNTTSPPKTLTEVQILSTEIKENHINPSKFFGVEICLLFFGFIFSFFILKKMNFKMSIILENSKQ